MLSPNSGSSSAKSASSGSLSAARPKREEALLFLRIKQLTLPSFSRIFRVSARLRRVFEPRLCHTAIRLGEEEEDGPEGDVLCPAERALARYLLGLPPHVVWVFRAHQDVENGAVPVGLHDDGIGEHATGELLVVWKTKDFSEDGLDLRGTTAVRVQAEHACHRIMLPGPRGLHKPALKGYLQDMVVCKGCLVVPVCKRRPQEIVVFRLDRDRLGLEVRDVGGHAWLGVVRPSVVPADSSRFFGGLQPSLYGIQKSRQLLARVELLGDVPITRERLISVIVPTIRVDQRD